MKLIARGDPALSHHTTDKRQCDGEQRGRLIEENGKFPVYSVFVVFITKSIARFTMTFSFSKSRTVSHQRNTYPTTFVPELNRGFVQVVVLQQDVGVYILEVYSSLECFKTSRVTDNRIRTEK